LSFIEVVAGFETNLIIGNNHDASAQEDQEEITTYYDTGLILCSNDNTPQQCDVPFRVTIETASVLKVGITVSPEHCSSTNYYVSVDGDEDTFGGTFIGKAGYSAIGDDSRTIPPYDFGTVESGSHTLDIWVEGIQGGCNQGYLSAWSGTLTVITSEPPEDTTPPVLTVPDDIVADAMTANGGTVVTYSVSAEDNVDGTATLEEDNTLTQDEVGGDITISCDPASGSEFPVGETVVECIATDIAGNSDTESFTVTVNPPPPPPPTDTTPPVITVPDDIVKEATAPNGATVSFEVSAEDDVDGPTDVDCDHNSGDTFPIGETVVTCTAEDLAGNSAEESFTITVQDTTAPDVEITKAVDKKGVAIAEGSTTKSHYIKITFEATDAVGVDKSECSLDGQAFTSSCTSPIVYDGLKKGTHNFTVRATDAAGNIGEDQFTWTVNPAEAAKIKPR
jgi:hypothetical protein